MPGDKLSRRSVNQAKVVRGSACGCDLRHGEAVLGGCRACSWRTMFHGASYHTMASNAVHMRRLLVDALCIMATADPRKAMATGHRVALKIATTHYSSSIAHTPTHTHTHTPAQHGAHGLCTEPTDVVQQKACNSGEGGRWHFAHGWTISLPSYCSPPMTNDDHHSPPGTPTFSRHSVVTEASMEG